MFIPVIQSLFNIYEEEELAGAYMKIEKPDFTYQGWLKGSYQSVANKYIEENIGFHNTFTRIRNQIRYSLFKKIVVPDQMLGKNGQWFSVGWTKNYLGLTYFGDEKADSLALQFKQFKKSMNDKNKQFLIALVPCKASYMPYNLPMEYQKIEKSKNSYDAILDICNKLDLHYIDFHKYFQEIKDTITYPLFVETGCHWSTYGAAIALDSILNYSRMLLQKDLMQIKIKNLIVPNKNDDYDIEKAMNLLFEIPKSPAAYPQIELIKDTCSYRPKVIIVGDSFHWTIKRTWKLLDIFTSDSWFFYYFTTAFPNNPGKSVPVKDMDIMKEVDDSDLIIFITSIGTMNEFPYGFVDHCNNNSN